MRCVSYGINGLVRRTIVTSRLKYGTCQNRTWLDSLLSHKNPSANDEPDTLICTHLTANDPLPPLLEVERNVVDRD